MINEDLYSRVRKLLVEYSATELELQGYLSDHDFKYSIAFINAFAKPTDIYVVAGFFGVQRSYLLEVTEFKYQFWRAVFDEIWPELKDRIKISKHEAWKIVSKN